MSAPADAHDIAVSQDNFKTENVVACDAILETPGTTGVCGDVAADKAFGAAGGIGRIVQAFGFGGSLKVFGNHARLHDRHKIGRVDFFDAIHPRE